MKMRGRTLVSPSGYSPEPKSSTSLGHAVSAEGDMITSALGFWHASVASVRASSHAMLGTVTTRVPPRVRFRARVRVRARVRARVRVRVRARVRARARGRARVRVRARPASHLRS